MNEPNKKPAAPRTESSVQSQDMDNLGISLAAPLVAKPAANQVSDLAPSMAEGVDQPQAEAKGHEGLNDEDLKALSDFFHDDFDFGALKKVAPQAPAVGHHPFRLSGRFLPLWRVNVRVQLQSAPPKPRVVGEADR
jgi:hypothetical protein